MKSLTKKQIKALEEVTGELEAKHGELTEALNSFNEEMNLRFEDDVKPKIEDYNDLLERAREMREDYVSAISDYIGDKSDKWQESDRGQAFESWKSALEEIELDEIDIAAPTDLETDITEHHALLGEAPTEPEL